MKIIDLDLVTGHMLVMWYPDSEYPQILNHAIPLQVLENPNISADEIKNIIELERPEQIIPVFNTEDDVPEGLKSFVEENKALQTEPQDFTIEETERFLTEYPTLGKAIVEDLGV